MINLEDYFISYGYPTNELNERFYIYLTKASAITSTEEVIKEDKSATEYIKKLETYVEVLKEYRKTLFERAQQLYSADYDLKLKIKRKIEYYNNDKKYYEVTLEKLLKVKNAKPIEVIKEIFPGKERFKAFKRYEELKRLHPGIDTEQDIEIK
jgi:hypothetical protein